MNLMNEKLVTFGGCDDSSWFAERIELDRDQIFKIKSIKSKRLRDYLTYLSLEFLLGYKPRLCCEGH